MADQAQWNGTRDESAALNNAIARNCSCEYNLAGARTTTCPSHEMLLHDQRALNGLLFMRRQVAQLRREEWMGRRRGR